MAMVKTRVGGLVEGVLCFGWTNLDDIDTLFGMKQSVKRTLKFWLNMKLARNPS